MADNPLNGIVASSQVIEDSSESLIDRNRVWMENSLSARERLFQLLPDCYDRMAEFVKSPGMDFDEEKAKAEFATKIHQLALLPAPTINHTHMTGMMRKDEYRHYTPPVIVTRQEIIEATRIAEEGEREDQRFKDIYLKEEKNAG